MSLVLPSLQMLQVGVVKIESFDWIVCLIGTYQEKSTCVSV